MEKKEQLLIIQPANELKFRGTYFFHTNFHTHIYAFVIGKIDTFYERNFFHSTQTYLCPRIRFFFVAWVKLIIVLNFGHFYRGHWNSVCCSDYIQLPTLMMSHFFSFFKCVLYTGYANNTQYTQHYDSSHNFIFERKFLTRCLFIKFFIFLPSFPWSSFYKMLLVQPLLYIFL